MAETYENHHLKVSPQNPVDFRSTQHCHPQIQNYNLADAMVLSCAVLYSPKDTWQETPTEAGHWTSDQAAPPLTWGHGNNGLFQISDVCGDKKGYGQQRRQECVQSAYLLTSACAMVWMWPPQRSCERPNARGDDSIRRWGLWGAMRSWGWNLQDGISALIKEVPRLFLSLMLQRESNPEKGLSQNCQSWHPGLRFPASRTLRNKRLLFIRPWVTACLWQQPEQTKTARAGSGTRTSSVDSTLGGQEASPRPETARGPGTPASDGRQRRRRPEDSENRTGAPTHALGTAPGAVQPPRKLLICGITETANPPQENIL